MVAVNGISGASGAGVASAGSKASNGGDAVQDFLSYMKESPAERMMDAWLHQHRITREQFEALSPEEKQKILMKMHQEIEDKIKQDTEKKLKQSGVSFL